MTHEGEESQSTPPYRSSARCSIWPQPVRQTRQALSKMSEIHVCVFFPSFPDNFQNEAIFGCNLPCLLPIKRDYRSINTVYAAEGASRFLSQSRFIFLEEHKGKIISCHYLECYFWLSGQFPRSGPQLSVTLAWRGDSDMLTLRDVNTLNKKKWGAAPFKR